MRCEISPLAFRAFRELKEVGGCDWVHMNAQLDRCKSIGDAWGHSIASLHLSVRRACDFGAAHVLIAGKCT